MEEVTTKLERTKQIINKFKEDTKKQCYIINTIDGQPTILDNKIGGKPYLPKGEQYPKDKNGEYMALLLQVNLKDIKLEGYPENGILEIFIDKDLDYPCQYVIKYFEEGLEYQEDLPEVNYENFIVTEPLKIFLKKGIDYMPTNDYRFLTEISEIIKDVTGDKVETVFDLDKVLGEDWYNLFDQNEEYNFITIGGYANFTQYDPRDNMKENKDECLFKLDSGMDFNKFMIGDAGILFSLISKDDITNCKFEKALVDWDCC